jgi:hypothetical protein
LQFISLQNKRMQNLASNVQCTTAPHHRKETPMSSASSRERSIAHAIVPSLLTIALGFTAIPVVAAPFEFSTGNPDGKIATATRPDTGAGNFEIESADDFVLTETTSITSATFTGLITGSSPSSSIGQVRVEIYRVFPALSEVGRTNGPPTFSTANVPTRVNSPSDVELDDRDTAKHNLNFQTNDLGSFSALNSVQPGGIHPKPGQTTGGNGPLTGEEFQFDVTFTVPFTLPADHYFFVPQVEITNGNGAFFWLSAPKPIVAPGTPFPPGFTDLQSWTRDGTIDPDWLRIGTDIVGGAPAPTFNAVFSLNGTAPEPATLALLGVAFAAIGLSKRRKLT